MAEMSRCQFKTEVLKQRAFVNGNDDLPARLSCDRPQDFGQMNDVNVVHVLNRVVEYKDVVSRLLDQIQCQEQA